MKTRVMLEITSTGSVRMLHDDSVDLSRLGRVVVTRASHVEYDNELGAWSVTSAKTGRKLYTAKRRDAALRWEKRYYSPSGKGWTELTGGKS